MFIFYFIVLFVLFAVFVSLYLFEIEMRKKSKYKYYLDDAVDMIEKGGSSNLDYPTFTNYFLRFSKNKDGEIEVKSCSCLEGVAIKY